MEGIATLGEIRSFWSILDIMRYDELLDIRREAELLAAIRRQDQIDSARGNR